MSFALFDNLGGAELVVVLVGALLVFGRKLPQVAADAARQLGSLKRGIDDAWRQSGVEKEIRDIQNVIPRDLSVTSVARQAARKFEERVAELGEGAKAAIEYPLPHEPTDEPPQRPVAPPNPPAAEPPSSPIEAQRSSEAPIPPLNETQPS